MIPFLFTLAAITSFTLHTAMESLLSLLSLFIGKRQILISIGFTTINLFIVFYFIAVAIFGYNVYPIPPRL